MQEAWVPVLALPLTPLDGLGHVSQLLKLQEAGENLICLLGSSESQVRGGQRGTVHRSTGTRPVFPFYREQTRAQ